jgi:hypothetical protein
MVAASGCGRPWRAIGGEGEGERGRQQQGEDCDEAGVIDRAGGNQKQQSADDGDDRKRMRWAIEQQVRKVRQEG